MYLQNKFIASTNKDLKVYLAEPANTTEKKLHLFRTYF